MTPALLGDDTLLTAEEAAKLLSISESQFRRLVIPPVVLGAHTHRWRVGAIRAEIRRREAR